MKKDKQYGLVGRNIGYSFSKNYFTTKFQDNNLNDCSYENFDIQTIEEFPSIINNNPNLKGLNVTIPYKESVMANLDTLSDTAALIGAVNTIKFLENGKTIGYNTDYFGFQKALEPLLKPHHKKALLLGTGGASKGVAFALKELGISYTFVSRKASQNELDYTDINAAIFDDYQIIVNCTPLGTSPNIDTCPPIPYEYFSPNHIAFDLIYNPEETLFLQKAKLNGAVIKNGIEMLVLQAEEAWRIWNE
ncbi:MAG: shikimate dehydrogenase [Bacteroidota bacterium]